MHCFFSHLIEAGYVDEIEMFFLIVGHTHNHLDQWFSVLSKAIKRSDKLMTVIALHELFRLAHKMRSDSDSKTPARVIQLTTYHDWVRYYAPVRNDSIMYYNIPHRVKFGPLVGGLKCPYTYMHFSPTAEWEAKWLPVAPVTAEPLSATMNDIPLSRYMLFNGDKTVARAIGLRSLARDSSSLMDGSAKTTDTLRRMQVAIPAVQQLEVSSIAESIVRGDFEAETGASNRSIEIPASVMEAVEADLLKENDERKGYIFWLRHSVATEVALPEMLATRPTILPNPVHWRGVITQRTTATATATAAADNAPASDSSRPQLNAKEKDELAVALDSIKRLNAGATKIAATAMSLLGASTSLLQRTTDESVSIAEATSMFTVAVLTPREVRWLESIKTVPLILASVEQRVEEESQKEWQLLRLPRLSAEGLAAREAIARALAERRAQVERGLLPLLQRSRDARVVPGQEFVTREGTARAASAPQRANGPAAVAMQGRDAYEPMKKPELLAECRRRGIRGISNTSVAALKDKLRTHDRDEALRNAANQIGIGSAIMEVAVVPSVAPELASLPGDTPAVAPEVAAPQGDTSVVAAAVALGVMSAAMSVEVEEEEASEHQVTVNTCRCLECIQGQLLHLQAPAESLDSCSDNGSDVPLGGPSDGRDGESVQVATVVRQRRGVAELQDWVESPSKRQAIVSSRLEDRVSKLDRLGSTATYENVKLLLDFQSNSAEFLLEVAQHYGLEIPRGSISSRRWLNHVLEEFISYFLNKDLSN